MENDVCAREGHDITVGESAACLVCGMPHDDAMRDMGFELGSDGLWSIEFPADQPIEFRGRW